MNNYDKEIKLGTKQRNKLWEAPSYEVPELRMSGQWLRRIGFKPGHKVEVTAREKLLVIRPVKINPDIKYYN